MQVDDDLKHEVENEKPRGEWYRCGARKLAGLFSLLDALRDGILLLRSRHSDTATDSKIEPIGVGKEVSPEITGHCSKNGILCTINSFDGFANGIQCLSESPQPPFAEFVMSG